MNKLILLLLLLVFYEIKVQAQKLPAKNHQEMVTSSGDTVTILAPFQTKTQQQKEKIYHPDSSHNPRKALFRSIILPGLGQVYNHQYWKLAIIYGGFAGLAYSYHFAQTNYKLYLHQASVLEINRRDLLIEPEKYKDLSPATAVLYYDYFRRNRDLTVILTGTFWVVQSIEAYIDAKFQHSYTMDNNLSFKLTPTVLLPQTLAFSDFVPGLKLTLKM